MAGRAEHALSELGAIEPSRGGRAETLAATVLRGREDVNVIRAEAVADVDRRMRAGDDPQEILAWVRLTMADDHVEVTTVRQPKRPNLSPPDIELYEAAADAPRARAPGAVAAPGILVGFTRSYTKMRLAVAAA